jgi:hypothetical protein
MQLQVQNKQKEKMFGDGELSMPYELDTSKPNWEPVKVSLEDCSCSQLFFTSSFSQASDDSETLARTLKPP